MGAGTTNKSSMIQTARTIAGMVEDVSSCFVRARNFIFKCVDFLLDEKWRGERLNE